MVMPRASACVAGAGDRRADVVGAVAGDVDDAAGAGDGAVLDQRGGEAERARDRGAAAAHHRGRLDLVGERRGGFGAVDDPPGDQRAVLRLGRPFEIGDRDLAGGPGGHRPDQVGVAEGGGVAVALHRELGHVHRARDIDREHDLGVDRGAGVRGGVRLRQGGVRPGQAEDRGDGEAEGQAGSSRRGFRPGLGRIGGAVQSRFR